MLGTIYITDGSASGLAFGFAYSASRLIHRLPKPRTRFIAGISIASIAYLLVIPSPHAVAHYQVAFFPNKTIIVEYLFHLSITLAVSVLAYYQHRFLVLSLSGRMNMMMKFRGNKMEENLTSETELRTKSSGMGSSSGVEMTDESHTME